MSNPFGIALPRPGAWNSRTLHASPLATKRTDARPGPQRLRRWRKDDASPHCFNVRCQREIRRGDLYGTTRAVVRNGKGEITLHWCEACAPAAMSTRRAYRVERKAELRNRDYTSQALGRREQAQLARHARHHVRKVGSRRHKAERRRRWRRGDPTD